MTDRRRYGVIEVRRINAETYHLKINGEMWSELEWSRSRQAWCVQDAAGQCLTHVEHIVGQDRDVQNAIRLAKRMIVDGRMPTPEDARHQLERERADQDDEAALDRIARQQDAAHQATENEYCDEWAERLGEPVLEPLLPDPVTKKRP